MTKLNDIQTHCYGCGLDPTLSEEAQNKIKALVQELIGPHTSLSSQEIKNNRIYVIGDPQADAIDRYKDELSKKVESL